MQPAYDGLLAGDFRVLFIYFSIAQLLDGPRVWFHVTLLLMSPFSISLSSIILCELATMVRTFDAMFVSHLSAFPMLGRNSDEQILATL